MLYLFLLSIVWTHVYFNPTMQNYSDLVATYENGHNASELIYSPWICLEVARYLESWTNDL